MSVYGLDALGWYQFERLCQTLLKARLGLGAESWGTSGDRGRDIYCGGSLRWPDPERAARGPFVFQAKFVQGANAAGARPGPALLRAVAAEARRIEERRRAGQWGSPRHYALLTNAPLSADLREQVVALIAPVVDSVRILVLGAADFDAWLDDMPNVRLSFPQILGLRDLTALLHRAVNRDIITRSTLALESTSELATAFVPTYAYNRTLTVLAKHGFAVLTGPPEMGKTSTARMVALARYTGGWEAFECQGPADFFAMYDRAKPQVFVADDAFGSTEYRPELAMAWAADLHRIVRAADRTHWIIWTSRPGPLNEALEVLYLQAEARDFPAPAEVQVDTRRLSRADKALMLYRHCKRARLDDAAADVIRRHCERIVDSKHFTPLRIERFVPDHLPAIVGQPTLRQAPLVRKAIAAGMQEPTAAMRTSFNALSEEHKSLLVAMLDAGPRDVALDSLAAGLERHLGGPAKRNARALADSIDEHFVRLER